MQLKLKETSSTPTHRCQEGPLYSLAQRASEKNSTATHPPPPPPPPLLRLKSSFLTDRIIEIKEGNNMSHRDHLEGRHSPGSTLRPLLFLIYVNNIPGSKPCKGTQCANDISLYTCHVTKNFLKKTFRYK